MPLQIPTVQVGLEQSIQQAMKNAGRGAQINLGTNSRQINALAQPLGRITGQADEFTKSMEAANARVFAFGASVGIINGVSKAFGALVKNTIEVEKSLTDINTVLNASTKELDQFGNKLFQVAKNTGQSFDVVAKGALELARQGLGTEETLKRINDALILSRLSGLDAAQSVEGLTAAFNSFKDSGATTSDILNKLVVVSQKFAVSERDLIEALKRSASVADQAGVSLDELIGIVTAVQERTARGGAVIGNAFKTIFSRIQDKGALQDLQDLGIQVTDTAGKILPATSILQNLAKEFSNLSQTEQTDLAKKLGGVYQLSNLLAAVKDLSSEQSKYAEAVRLSSTATDQAYKKNAALNETLASLINKVSVSAQQLGATLGQIGIADSAKNLLGFFNGLLESIQKILGEESAMGTFVRGLVKGIGNLISGPGLALFAAIIAKLSKDLIQFGFASLKSFFGIGKAAKEIESVEKSIANALSTNINLQRQLFALEGNRAAQIKLMTDAVIQQEAAMRRMTSTAGALAGPLYQQGVRSVAGQGLRVPKAAGGYMPAVAGEASDIRRGVGGAKSGDKPVVIPNFAFGGGKRGTMVANTGEYIVPNFAGTGSAIFNRNMVRSMGMPAGAKKINAAGGFIPNFAFNQKNYEGFLKQFSSSRIPDVEKYAAGQGRNKTPEYVKAAKDFLAKRGGGSYLPSASVLDIDADKLGGLGVVSVSGGQSQSVTTSEGRGQMSQAEINFLDQYFGKGVIERVQISNIQSKSLGVLDNNLAQDNQKAFRNIVKQQFTPPLIDIGAKLIGKVFKGNDRADVLSKLSSEKNDPALFSESVLGGIFESAIRIATKSAGDIQAFDDFDANSAFDFEEGAAAAQEFIKAFGFDRKIYKADAKKTANSKTIQSIIGKSLRDEGVKNRIKSTYFPSPNLKKAIGAAGGYIPNFALSENALNSLRLRAGYKGNDPRLIAEAKIAQSKLAKYSGAGSKGGVSLRFLFDRDGMIGSRGLTDMVNYAYKQSPSSASSDQVFKTFEMMAKREPNISNLRRVAQQKGYIPNFVDPLKAAIGREMAAGVPASQIYVDKNPSLKNALNPMGLMVANRRDEPIGGVQGINRARREGMNPQMYGAANGFVPNYANYGAGTMLSSTGGNPSRPPVTSATTSTGSGNDPNTPKQSRDFLGTIFAVQSAMSVLTGATDGATSGLGKFTNSLSNTLGTISTVAFAAQGLKSFAKEGGTASKALQGFGTAIIGASILVGGFKLVSDYIKIINKNFDLAAISVAGFSDQLNKFKLLEYLPETEQQKASSKIEAKNIIKNAEYDFYKSRGFNSTGRGLDMLTNDVLEGRDDILQAVQAIRKTKLVSDKELKELITIYKGSSKGNAEKVVELLNDFASNQIVLSNTITPKVREYVESNPQQNNEKDVGFANQFSGFEEQVKSYLQAIRSAKANQKEIEKEAIPGQINQIRLDLSKSILKSELELNIARQRGLDSLDKQKISAEIFNNLSKEQLDNLNYEIEKRDLIRQSVDSVVSLLNEQLTSLNGISGKEKETEMFRKRIESLTQEQLLDNQGILKLMDEMQQISIEDAGLRKAESDRISSNLNQFKRLREVFLKNLELKKQETIEIEKQNDITNSMAAKLKAASSYKIFGQTMAADTEIQRKNLEINRLEESKSGRSNEEIRVIEKAVAARKLEITQLENSKRANESLVKARTIFSEALPQQTSQYTKEFISGRISSIDEAISQVETRLQNAKPSEQKAFINALSELKELKQTSEFQNKSAIELATQQAQMAGKAKDVTYALDLFKNSLEDVPQKIEDLKFEEMTTTSGRRLKEIAYEKQTLAGLSNLEEKNATLEERAAYIRSRSVKPMKTLFDEEFSKTAEENAMEFNKSIVDASVQFKNNLIDGLSTAIAEGQKFSDILRNATLEFAKNITKASMNNLFNSVTGTLFKASGGPISGGSGTKDDVPAMLMGGEYVINKKAVQKYGMGFLNALNSGSLGGYAAGGAVTKDLFTPGTFGQEGIVGNDLLRFASQSYTGGMNDVIMGGGAAALSLEPESMRLTNFGRRFGSQAESTRAAKEQALGLYIQEYEAGQEARRKKKADKKAFKKQLATMAIMAVASMGLNAAGQGFKSGFGASKAANGTFLQNVGAGAKGIFNSKVGGLNNLFTGFGGIFKGDFSKLKLSQGIAPKSPLVNGGGLDITPLEQEELMKDSFYRQLFNNNQLSVFDSQDPSSWRPRATGGMIPNSSGVDTISAMLSGGEFVMNRAAAQNIGAGNLQSLNAGSSSLMTEEASEELNNKLISKLDELIEATGSGAGNITINVDAATGSATQTADGSSTEDRQQLARQIKDVVLKVIQDEKRIGGQLRRGM